MTGIGKCSHVSTYAASLLSSTGNPAYYLHGTEAVHGSCGQLAAGDVVIAISNSGETGELKATVLAVQNNGCKVIGVSGNPDSWLARESDAFLFAGVKAEGGPLNRAPRASVLAELLTLQAPVRMESGPDGHVTALWTQPQIIGQADKNGRPSPNGADQPELRVPADIIIVAIGQGIETHGFEQSGIKIQRGGTILADSGTHLPDMEGVFAGGDCVTGPATVIRAIAAGKAAADNIDEYLGFSHEIRVDVEIPAPHLSDFTPRGRVSTTEREAGARKMDFQCIECGMTLEEAQRESARCLRCDHFGYGVFKGGREEKW